MVDGPTEAADLAQTESNREVVRSFVDDVLINRRLEKLEHYIDLEAAIKSGLAIDAVLVDGKSEQALSGVSVGHLKSPV